MDLENLAFFRMNDQKMRWINQRQKTIAQNISNANTPGYMPRDLNKVSFRSHLTEQSGVSMRRTDSQHMGPVAPSPAAVQTHAAHSEGTLPQEGQWRSYSDDSPYETSIDENGVILEEQLLKMNETRSAHRLSTTLYKKHVKMLRSALGK